MAISNYYNYEDSMLCLDEVLDLIDKAVQNYKPLSIGRYGHGEIAYLGWSEFPTWKVGFDPHGYYAGATAPVSIIKADLLEALRTTDIVGFHASWGDVWEDRGAADLTKKLLQGFEFTPEQVCSAYITHEMIKCDRFWKSLENLRVVLVGRRAAEASKIFKNKGINVTYTTVLEGYQEIEKVYKDLSIRTEWDIALISAGIPATVLAPMLANNTNKVVIDFGHALDKLIEGESYDYIKILNNWKAQAAIQMLVSIVMAVYNGEKFLKDALDSVLSQTYSNIEIIVVNDGSIDGTMEILNAIDDNRLKVIHLEKNQGAANALNIGITHAMGTWIAIQDADDISYPTRIEEQVKYIAEHPELVGVGTLIDCIPGGTGISDALLRGVAKNKNLCVSREDIRNKIFWSCPLTHSSVMFSKAIFGEVGGYCTDFKIAYDYDLWLKILEKGEMENVSKVLLHYRINKNSLSNKDGIATINEVQIASSRAISRFLNKGKEYQPKVIVIGPLKGCKNYKRYIAPVSGLNVEDLIYDDWSRQVPKAIKKLKTGKIEAIILLDGYKSYKNLQYLKTNKIELNKKIINIYNILK